MLIVGLDPGTAITGYGVVDYKSGKARALRYGVIRTAAEQPMHLRLLLIQQELNALFDEVRPDAVAIEQIFHHRNAKTVITVAQARGVMVVTAAARGIELFEYTPLQVKQAVCGYGRADKQQVQIMVQKLLRLDERPQPDDAADALAIAICHLHSYKMKAVYKEGEPDAGIPKGSSV